MLTGTPIQPFDLSSVWAELERPALDICDTILIATNIVCEIFMTSQYWIAVGPWSLYLGLFTNICMFLVWILQQLQEIERWALKP